MAHSLPETTGFAARRALALAAVVLLACSSEQPENGRCELTVWYRPVKALAALGDRIRPEEAERPALIGSWNGWKAEGGFERVEGDGGEDWRVKSVKLAPGTYEYGLLIGDQVLVDLRNPRGVFGPDPLGRSDEPYGTELSQVIIPDCSRPQLAFESLDASGDTLSWKALLTPGNGSKDIDTGSFKAELRRGSEPMAAPSVHFVGVDGRSVRLALTASGLAPGKYTVTLSGTDGSGNAIGPISASGFVEEHAAGAQLEDGLVYQIMVDRFLGDAGALAAPQTPGNRAGGTLGGVRAAIEAGYFERLGVTTLWLSPVIENPPGTFVGRDGHLYEAYHGYWPLQPRSVEPKLGGEAALDALISAAHARGLRVVLDVVPNHLDRDHPYFVEHSRSSPEVALAADPRAASWFNDGEGACVCGRDCDWGANMETCWFDAYLPDLNWRQPEASAAGIADLRWWMERFDLDGLRIDAVPMMPRASTRAMAREVRAATWRSGLDGLVLGEVYTGPGEEGREEIRSYLGRDFDGLDSAFDFPLMWSLREVIARGEKGFEALEAEVAAGDEAWSGSGAVMARIIGNHDTNRFVSEAMGDGWGDPWSAPALQPEGPEPYRRQLLALTFVLTMPGLPVIYYGDEVGLAGSGDPDCRRVLPDVLGGNLPATQAELLQRTGALGRARREVPALRRGARRVIAADGDLDVSVREEPPGQGGGAAIVVLNRSPDSPQQRLLQGLPDGDYQDLFSRRTLAVRDGKAEIGAEPLSASVFLSAGSPGLQ
jgi:glycosidase